MIDKNARLNYCSQAIEMFQFLAVSSKKNGHPRTAEVYEWLSHLMQQGQKFILPQGGRVLSIDQTMLNEQIPLEMIRLPFPITIAESSRPVDSRLTDYAAASLRRIAIGIKLNEVEMPGWIRKQFQNQCTDPDAIGLISVHHAKDQRWKNLPDGLWAFGQVMGVIDTGFSSAKPTCSQSFWDSMGMASALIGSEKTRKTNYSVFPVVIAPDSYPHLVQVLGQEKALATSLSDLSDELSSIIDLTLSLACLNVETETIASPKSLNEKRARKGKPPFFEYKVLKVRVSAQHGTLDKRHGDGLRASPRQHFRRGHIRVLDREKMRITWVAPASVGSPSNGFIDKDYMIML